MNLDELLELYKNITLDMIKRAEEEEELEISALIETRDQVLKKISQLEVDGDAIKKKVESLNIIEFEEKLQSLVKDKMLATKNEINKLNQFKVAYNRYANFKGNSMIFNTTI